MSRFLSVHQLIFVALQAIAVVYILMTIAQLPDTVATHFRGDGYANGFMTRPGYRLFMLIFTLGLPLLLVGLIGYLPGSYSRWSNLPHKDYWFAPERRAQSLAYLRRLAYWFGSLMVLFSVGLHGLVLDANAQMPARLDNDVFLIFMLLFLLGLVIWVVALLRHFGKPPA